MGVLRFGWLVSDVRPGVSVLFSVPKKVFRRAWKRNLIKRRMRESYRVRKHELFAAATAAGVHVDIALICSPQPSKMISAAATQSPAKTASPSPRHKKAPIPPAAIPDFKDIDDAIEKILGKILARL
jgi:hypothetical protein